MVRKLLSLQRICHQTNPISDHLGHKVEVWSQKLISSPSIHPPVINWQRVNSKGESTDLSTAFTGANSGEDKLKARSLRSKQVASHPSICAKRIWADISQPKLQNAEQSSLFGRQILSNTPNLWKIANIDPTLMSYNSGPLQIVPLSPAVATHWGGGYFCFLHMGSGLLVPSDCVQSVAFLSTGTLWKQSAFLLLKIVLSLFLLGLSQ